MEVTNFKMESILDSIKTMLGIEPDYTHFDKAIIEYINTAFMTLNQLGVGPENPVVIANELDTWASEFSDISNIEGIKTYTFLNVQLFFDPPSTSFVLEAKQRQIAELEFRLTMQQNYYNKEG